MSFAISIATASFKAKSKVIDFLFEKMIVGLSDDDLKKMLEILRAIKVITDIQNKSGRVGKKCKIFLDDFPKHIERTDIYRLLLKIKRETSAIDVEIDEADIPSERKISLWTIDEKTFNLFIKQLEDSIAGRTLRDTNVDAKNGEKQSSSNDENKSNNNVFDFPKDLRWEEIEIRFLGSEDVVIITRSKHTPTNCELMGFQDKKTKRPDLQWKFLQILAEKGGAISWENNYDLTKKVFDTVKSKKKTIKKRLQYIFNISSDPFYPYKKEKAYRIKLKLTPEIDISMATNDESKDDWRDVYNDALTPKFKKKDWNNDEYNETDDD